MTEVMMTAIVWKVKEMMTTTTVRGTKMNLTNPSLQFAICHCQEMCRQLIFQSEFEKINGVCFLFGNINQQSIYLLQYAQHNSCEPSMIHPTSSYIAQNLELNIFFTYFEYL